MKRSCLLLLMAAMLGATTRVRADSDAVTQAKGFFKASAGAYEMGDYLAAIQALESAYRLTPLPAIAFSLAQAERRQYFVSHERAHLERAIELFRTYLQQLTTGGRRADATDALAQLEPLAALSVGATNTEAAPAPLLAKTRVMITCEAPQASVALDGAPGLASPLIAQVAPGKHRVVVSAKGYFAAQRSIDAVEGEFVPLEIALHAQPASVALQAPAETDVHVDGVLVGDVASHARLELPSGVHVFSFAKNGRRVQTVRAQLEPGSKHTISATLSQTGQRATSVALFIATGASLGAGLVFSALAIDREHSAVAILNRRASGNISAHELDDYDAATRARGLFRAAAIASFAASAASLVTGAFLFALDHPDVQSALARPDAENRTQLRASLLLPGATLTPGIHVQGRF